MTRFPTYEDQTEIMHLLHEYARRIDTGDLEGFAQLFRHGTWLGRDGEEECLAWLRGSIVLYEGETWTQHLVSNVQVELGATPGAASAHSCITVVQQPPGQAIRLVRVNTYEDTFVRIDGAWWFATRDVSRRMLGDDSAHLRLPA